MLEIVNRNIEFDADIENIYIAKVWDGSSTDQQTVILNKSNIASEVNVRTITEVEYSDGSKEIGFGRLLSLNNSLTETSPQFQNMLAMKWSSGHDTYQQAKNEMEIGINLLEYVVRVDNKGNYISKAGEFRNTPQMETKVYRFTGTETNILKSSPFTVKEFGVDYSDDSPNYNYLSTSKERGEGRNKVFVGPQGSGKTISKYETIIQNIDTPISHMVIDFDGQYSTDRDKGLDLKTLCESNDKTYREFCSNQIVETYSLKTLKRVAKECGVYRLKLIINTNGTSNNLFVDDLLEYLDQQELFVKKDSDLEMHVSNYLTQVASEEDETLEGILTEKVAKAKKKEIQVKLSNSNQLDRIFRALNETKSRFFKSENKYTAEEIVTSFLEDDNQIFVIYPPKAEYGKIHVDPFGSLVMSLEQLLYKFYSFIENNKKLYDHGLIIDEFQILFPRKIDSKNPNKDSLYAIRSQLQTMLSKHRKFGFYVWAAFPNQQMVDKILVDLLSTHERYLMAGLTASDCDIFLSGISDPVRKMFYKLTRPEKSRINGKLVIKFYFALLAGEQSPFQATGDGNIIKLYPSFLNLKKERK